MLSNLLEQILYFKNLYPVRFAIISAIGLILITLVIVFGALYRKSRVTNKIIDEGDIHNNELEEAKTPPLSESLKNYFLLSGIALGLFILILGCSFLASKRITYKPKVENIQLSKSNYVFGIDISHYQGRINWHRLKKSKHPIKYIFIRATMGADGLDSKYKRNWKKAKKHGYLRGAYHFYRPNENSTEQFNNFASRVSLESNDFKPVLDVETMSKYGIKNLRKGVLNWLKLAEKKYKTKPIVYTGKTFYLNYLKGHIDDYPLWIASYNSTRRLKGIPWHFHQFTDKVNIKGIPHKVDGNDFKGTIKDLNKMKVKYFN